MVDQKEYIQSLKPIKIDKLVEKTEKLSEEKFREYRALTGQLYWAAELTRPDISFDTRELSTKNKEATYLQVKNKGGRPKGFKPPHKSNELLYILSNCHTGIL